MKIDRTDVECRWHPSRLHGVLRSELLAICDASFHWVRNVTTVPMCTALQARSTHARTHGNLSHPPSRCLSMHNESVSSSGRGTVCLLGGMAWVCDLRNRRRAQLLREHRDGRGKATISMSPDLHGAKQAWAMRTEGTGRCCIAEATKSEQVVAARVRPDIFVACILKKPGSTTQRKLASTTKSTPPSQREIILQGMQAASLPCVMVSRKWPR